MGKITEENKETLDKENTIIKELVDNPPANVHFIGLVERTKMNNIFERPYMDFDSCRAFL